MSEVPKIPPLSSVSDPAVRRVLQALLDIDRVRSGEVGSGDNKYLTVADLEAGLKASPARASGAPSLSVSAGGGTIATRVANTLAGLKAWATESRLWKQLGERLDHIDTPEWFTKRFGAAIKDEQNIRESMFSAMATKTQTVITAIDDKLSLVRVTLKSTSDLAGSTASAVTALQTTVADVSANAEEALTLVHTVDQEIRGSWTVKFDVNGYVTGAGLSLDAKGNALPESKFIIRADAFIVGTPAHPNIPQIQPFYVITQSFTTSTGLVVDPGVYMNTAFIGEATIGTLHLDGYTVSRSYYTSAETTWLGDGVAYDLNLPVAYSNINPAPQSVILMANARIGNSAGGGDGSVTLQLLRDGVPLTGAFPFFLRASTVSSAALTGAYNTPETLGAHTYTLRATVNGGPWSGNPLSLVVLTMKR